MAQLAETMHRARRLKEQKTKSKNKLYAFHAPEVRCISKGKARQPYEFGVKASFAVTVQNGLIVGARAFPGNPYTGRAARADGDPHRYASENRLGRLGLPWPGS